MIGNKTVAFNRFVRYLIVIWLIAFIGIAIYFGAAKLKETGDAKRVKQLGGYVTFDQHGLPSLVNALGDAYPFKTINTVSFSRKTTDEDLSTFQSLRQAKSVLLNLSAVRGPGLANFKEWPLLSWIDLTRSSVTDDGLQTLATLTRIKGLSLAYTKITDQGIMHLEKLSNLEELDLSGTEVDDRCLPYLYGLPLKELNVSKTMMTRDGIERIKKQKPTMQIYSTIGK